MGPAYAQNCRRRQAAVCLTSSGNRKTFVCVVIKGNLRLGCMHTQQVHRTRPAMTSNLTCKSLKQVLS